MIKVVYAWRDRTALGAERCEQHYLSNHVQLARKAFVGTPGFRALVYNRVRETRVNHYNARTSVRVEPEMDAFIELYFDDLESMEQAFKQPTLTAMFEDHENFMETETSANVHIYYVEETLVAGSLPSGAVPAPSDGH
jgi:uncharacterized protein (TIGR02118 family)